MSSRPTVPTAPLPALPHWEQTPADLPDAIRQTKAALRARIAASGRTVEEVFAVVQDQIEHEVGEITAARERGENFTGRSTIRYPPASSRAVISGSMSKRSAVSGSPRARSPRMIL